MSGAQSISARRAYGVQRVCRVWGRARSSVYVRRHATRSRASRRRGPVGAALLHESSRARTMPTDKILTCRCGTTLVGRGRSSDSRSHSRGRPHSLAQLDSGREGHRR